VIVRTDSELAEMLEMMEKSRIICIDTETVDKGYPDTLLTGVALSCLEQAVYVPTGHKDEACLCPEVVVNKLKEMVSRYKGTIVMHHAAYDMKVLDLVVDGGFEFPEEQVVDTMVASWLLDTEGLHGLKSLAERYLGIEMIELKDICKTEKHTKTGDKVFRTDLIPLDVMEEYAIDDVIVPIALWEKVFEPRLKEEGLEKVYRELEIPFVFILTEMEKTGAVLNKERLEELREEMPKQLEELKQEIYSLRPSGEPFNIGSQPQLNKVLFEELGIKPIGERGKSGYFSTKKENIEKWAKDYEIARKILECRRHEKLIGTYVEGLSNRVWKDGRIRSSFRRTIKTGRISSSKPNLQNIPNAQNDIYGLRGLFTVPEDKKMIVADYSQIELRVLAHISRDDEFIRAYREGADIHSLTAQALFGLKCSVDEVKEKHPDLRAVGKTFNFGNVYGAGIKALATNAGVSEDKARRARDNYYKRFPKVKRYLDWVRQYARDNGYVKTLVGRKRHLPDAQLSGKSQDENAKIAMAERQAGNSPIQGGAADIMIVAMRNLRDRLRAEGLAEKAKFTLQVHDEIIMEVDKDVVKYVAKIAKEEMESAVKLRVPLVADMAIVDRWDEAKD